VTPEFNDLRQLSADLGADPLLVQAAGGNTSLKQDGVMWIKASGTWLRDAAAKDIFVPLDLRSLSAALIADDPDCENCLAFVRQDLNMLGLRPSIETSVHGLMPQAVVLHVHCVNTIAWAMRSDAEAQLRGRLSDFNWSFIPYARPGLQLSRSISRYLRPGSDVMILENHGLAVAADTVASAEILLRAVVKALDCEVRESGEPDLAELERVCFGRDYVPARDRAAHGIAFDSRAVALGCTKVYYPDHVVFLGASIPRDMNSDAAAVVVPGKGMVVHKAAKPSVEPMLGCLAEVFLRTASDAPLKALTAFEVDQLLNWDAEKYRQSLTQP
jgi:rhamnose utilization protein RhaD (predicted bifunctional aldolase and dehydrogenase)